MYLKLASFQFVDEGSEEDKVDINMFSGDFLHSDEPSNYQSFTLKDFQELARLQLEGYNQSRREMGRNFAGLNAANLCRQQMHIAQSLFFSGQFSSFVRFLLSADERYFVDTCHICLPLQRLNLLKTKFLLTKLLYNPKASGMLKKSVREDQLRSTFLGIGNVDEPAIDLVALLGYYMNQMKLNGDESLLDLKERLIQEYSYNGFTDAACFSYVMEDEAVGEAFLSNYILNNKESAIDTLLEHNGKEFLYFRESCMQQKPSVVAKGFSMLASTGQNKSLNDSRASIDSSTRPANQGKP